MTMSLTVPDPSEYDAFYADYVAEAGEIPVLDQLAVQVDDTVRLLQPLSEQQAGYRYAPGKWTVKEVVGHVIDAERVFAGRALHFARRDPAPLPGFDQGPWVLEACSDERPLRSLLAELEAVRRSTLALFRSFPTDVWDSRGMASEVEFTVRAVLFIIAGHELHHRRVLEERYLRD
jgi:uncharacterized damage-inducible protein DinB